MYSGNFRHGTSREEQYLNTVAGAAANCWNLSTALGTFLQFLLLSLCSESQTVPNTSCLHIGGLDKIWILMATRRRKILKNWPLYASCCVVVSVCVSCLMPSAHKCPSGWGPASRSACCCALFSSEWYHRIIDQLTSVLLVHVGPKMSQDVPRDGSSRSQILVSRDLFRAKSAMH